MIMTVRTTRTALEATVSWGASLVFAPALVSCPDIDGGLVDRVDLHPDPLSTVAEAEFERGGNVVAP